MFRSVCTIAKKTGPKRWYVSTVAHSLAGAAILFFLTSSLLTAANDANELQPQVELALKHPLPRTALDLAKIPYKIVYETYRKTEGKDNWELFIMNADGSNQVNLTNTPDVDEMYPHVSPDGTKICFEADEGTADQKVRSVYYMNIDGSGRTKAANNARLACWGPDSKSIAYSKGEFERYSPLDYATKGLFFFDIQTGKHREHPNKEIQHLYNFCWSPDGKWILGTIHGGLGYSHAIIAIEAEGTGVFEIKPQTVRDEKIMARTGKGLGCRPELSADGRKLTWTTNDRTICVADINLAPPAPQVSQVRRVVNCENGYKTYHVDFSPDGRYLTFSYGPEGDETVGYKAPGWNICVSDLQGNWVQITDDGNHNKEPDWVPLSR